MKTIRELKEALGKVQGPLPYYSLSHAVLLILALESGPIGRKRISSIMMLGEGSVRSLISKLREMGWINCSREGCALTELGIENVRELRKCLSGPLELYLRELFEGVAYAALVKCVNYFNLLELRDEAVRCGGRGAVILRKIGGALIFPDTGEALSKYAPNDSETLERSLKPEEGDLVIIGIGSDKQESKLSAIAPSLLAMGDP